NLLPEIMLRALTVVPPIVLPEELAILTPTPFPSANVPVTSVPILFPATTFPVLMPFGGKTPLINTPLFRLPEITLPAPAPVPPLVTFDAAGPTTTPLPEYKVIISPRTVLLLAVIVSPLTLPPAWLPLITMIGAPAKPGCVVPSITTESVISGSAEVGW